MAPTPFDKQVTLLLSVLPHVMSEKKFALKGGTAINFFLRNLPRLSVDIDLTYLPVEDRESSLADISHFLDAISKRIRGGVHGVQVQHERDKLSKRTKALLVYQSGTVVKIEPNEVLRGTVFPCQERDLCKSAQARFGMFASVTTLSVADLYGGKICAALDRQHPRDLFDIKILLDNEGITEQIRRAFVLYLASSDRPMYELLEPIRQDVQTVFEGSFAGMATIPVKYDELVQAREALISGINSGLTLRERRFLLSLKEGSPEWGLLGLDGIDKLPGIQWKLTNIHKMDKRKHAQAVAKLKRVLDL